MRVCLILVLASLAACADEAHRARDFESHKETEIAALTARGTPQSLATASLLSILPGKFTTGSRSQQLIDRAVALEPSAALLYVQWRECASAACPDEERIIAHLKAIDPENGLAWLPQLQTASDHGSASEITQALEKIGASKYMSIYWNSLLVMMVDEQAATKLRFGKSAQKEDPFWRMTFAIGILSAISIPPLQPMGKSCRLDQIEQPGRRTACEAMTARLMESDNVLMQSLGISIQEKWWPEGSPEHERLHAQHQQLYYVLQASDGTRILHVSEDAAARLEAMRRSNREIDAMQAMLIFYHKPLQRPVNWEDPYLRHE
ncbi:MAG TPA: hypothetical protein VGD54_02455 [Steroidobacteraceae bacterium]